MKQPHTLAYEPLATDARTLLQRARSQEGVDMAREYLSRAKRLNNEIAVMHSRIETLRERSRRVATLSLACAARSGTGDPVGEAAQLIADLESKVLEKYCRLTSLEREIGEVIARLGSDKHRIILHMHYVDGVSLPVVAMRLCFEESNIYKLHRKALTLVALILLTEEENFVEKSEEI